MRFFALCLSLLVFSLYSQECENELLNDLLVVDYWNKRLNETFPVYFDHLLQGGYFSMPSARMGKEGEIGAGYGYIHPYIHYNLRFQLVDFLEISGSYRIFKGVPDPVLSRYGYGDYSDKGANLKFSLFSPEESRYQLPGVAIGLEDFIGTSSFKAAYIVFTKVFLDYHLEVSLGYGRERIRRWFGGACWMPFIHSEWTYLRPLALIAEYDAIPYKDTTIEKHPKGRSQYTHWNIGMKYRLWDQVDLSLAFIKGNTVAFTASSFYNFGYTKGFLPKLADPLTYQAPVNFKPLGCMRTEKALMEELTAAFGSQGFELLEMRLTPTELQLHLVNGIYREEKKVREKLNALLAALVPEGIEQVKVIFYALRTPIQEYHYQTVCLKQFKEREIGAYELQILTPLKEVSQEDGTLPYFVMQNAWTKCNLELLPKTHMLFGSSRGKFKHALGLSLALNGFLPSDIYYSISFGWFLLSNLKNIHNFDRLNPSQLLSVKSTIIDYYKQRTPTLDEAFVERTWNCGRGWFTRLSCGFFEQQYGGIGVEWLYYPVRSNWAIGMEGALVQQRKPFGIGFRRRIRQLHAFRPHYHQFLGSQYFLNLYYDCKEMAIECKVSLGQFLAKDIGIRTQLSRYFPSGLRLGFWYAYTNGKDKINGQIYHDKGLFLSMPLDIFYTCSSRTRWNYGLSAWLRDVGVRAYTGTELYDMINEQRQ